MRLIRRQLIQASGVAAGGMAFGLAPYMQRARAQPKAVVILGIWPFTGLLADSGTLLNRGMKLAIEEWDGKVLGQPIKYLTRREFSRVVAKAAAAKPDVLCLVSAVQDFILQVREAHNFGLAPKVALVQPWGFGSEELAQLDAKTRDNLWTGTNGDYTIDTPVARMFAEVYEKRYGLPPAMLRPRPTA